MAGAAREVRSGCPFHVSSQWWSRLYGILKGVVEKQILFCKVFLAERLNQKRFAELVISPLPVFWRLCISYYFVHPL